MISKGTRALQPVPASPEALRLLAAYFDERGTPPAGEVIWRTLRGKPQPLSYFAARRVLQRANALLGTDWSLHDLGMPTIGAPGMTCIELDLRFGGLQICSPA